MVAAALPLIGAVVGAVGSIGAAALSKPKTTQVAQPVPLPTITPRGNSAISDALARRRGSAANQLTGGSGAESSATAKKTLLGN